MLKRKRHYAKKKIYDTANLERELIKILLTDIIILRLYVAKVKKEWMTADSRWFIIEKIQESFRETKTLLSKDALFYEIEKEFDEDLYQEELKEYKKEVEYIFNKIEPVENIEFLMNKFKEAEKADELLQIIEKSYKKLTEGEIDRALEIVKTGSLQLNISKEHKKTMALHKDAEEWFEEVIRRRNNPELYSGIKTGFKKFDDLTGGLFKAELTIVFGLSGKGKSTVLKNICSYVRRSGFNVLHVTNEENQWQVLMKYQSLESGIKSYKFKTGKLADEEIEQWKNFEKQIKTRKEGEIYVLEISQYEDASVIEAEFYRLQELGINIDLVCIDYMDLMAPIHKAYSENDEQAKITNDCKQLAIDIDRPVLSATQAGSHTEKLEKQDRPFLSAQDIYGTKRRTHSANTLIGLINKTATVNVTERTLEERNIHKMVFCVPKNRDGPIFTFRQIMHVDTGKIEEDPDDDDPWVNKIEQHGKQILEETVEIEKKKENNTIDVPVVNKKMQNLKELERLEKEVKSIDPIQIQKTNENDIKNFLKTDIKSKYKNLF